MVVAVAAAAEGDLVLQVRAAVREVHFEVAEIEHGRAREGLQVERRMLDRGADREQVADAERAGNAERFLLDVDARGGDVGVVEGRLDGDDLRAGLQGAGILVEHREHEALERVDEAEEGDLGVAVVVGGDGAGADRRVVAVELGEGCRIERVGIEEQAL